MTHSLEFSLKSSLPIKSWGLLIPQKYYQSPQKSYQSSPKLINFITNHSHSLPITLNFMSFAVGGGFTFIKMTWYCNDRDIKFGTLLKDCILFFNCGTLMQEGEQTMGGDSPLSKWHDITMTEISSLVLHLSFNFGTLMQEGSLRSSSCTKVLHIFLFLVLWCS